jgi:DNA-binding GntR family transcriptional regulator
LSDDRGSAITQAIRNAIIEQAVKPGTRLPEDTIGERFGASRTLVRAALTQLAAEGLVELRRNRGAIVAEPSWNEARDTFDLRLALEQIVIERVAGTLQPDQIAQLEAHVKEEEKVANRDEAHSIRLAGEFHILLAEMTGSKVLTQYMRELSSRCCLMLALYSRPHSSECGVSEHQHIVDLLKSGAGRKELTSAMHEHMKGVVDRALIQPPKREDRDIGDILAAYVSG